MKPIKQIITKKIERHILKSAPNEACGLILTSGYLPCKNIALDPKTSFKIDNAVVLEHFTEIVAVVHSHIVLANQTPKYDPRWMSSHDMKTWIAMNVPFIIYATDEAGSGLSQPLIMDDSWIPELEEREFINGYQDCYSVIRDWFRLERGIKLKNYPRGMDWWSSGEDLYSDNFTDAGFVVINKQDAKIGDCVLMRIRAPVINHAAVITNTNEILHHPFFNSLSRRDSLNRWESQIVQYIRYVGEK